MPCVYFSVSWRPRAPSSTLFPYTTLFRSTGEQRAWTVQLTESSEQPKQGPAPPGPVSSNPGAVPPAIGTPALPPGRAGSTDRKSTRLNSSHPSISYAVFCLKKKKRTDAIHTASKQKTTPLPYNIKRPIEPMSKQWIAQRIAYLAATVQCHTPHN